MRGKNANIYDELAPADEPMIEWLLPELQAALRERRQPEEFGLRRLAEFPDNVVRLGRGHEASSRRSGLA